MRCPICDNRTGIEIDIHSDGYADNLLECSRCGTIWMETVEGTVMLNNKAA